MIAKNTERNLFEKIGILINELRSGKGLFKERNRGQPIFHRENRQPTTSQNPATCSEGEIMFAEIRRKKCSGWNKLQFSILL